MASGVKKETDPVLNIKNEMAQFDNKNRNFFDSLNDEQKKKFSPYMMIRWGSAVYTDDPDLQDWYLQATNERLNLHFFDINSTVDKKMQWLMATTVSPGRDILKHYGGTPTHKWIPPKKQQNNNRAAKFIRALYPTLKEEDIELMAKINSIKELQDYARSLGWDEKRIKEEL